MAFSFVAVAAMTTTASADRADVSVIEEDADHIVLQFDFNAPTLRDIEIDGVVYKQVRLGNEPITLTAGSPELPKVARSVMIPGDAGVRVRVIDGVYQDLESINIVPSKGNLLRTVDPATVPYTFGPVYKTNAFYPAEPVATADPYIMRSVRGVAVTAYPFQYNPVTRTVRAWETMTIEIDLRGTSAINTLGPELKSIDHNWDAIYEDHFLNYQRDEFTGAGTMPELGPMLIICYDSFMSAMTPYVDHKNSIGIDTDMVPLSSVGSSSAAVQSYISAAYSGGDLCYVLLVGDIAQVPSLSAAGGASDPSYALLAGSDTYPEVMIGRFSAENVAHVNTMVQRTIEYEENQATTQAWYWKAIGIASDQGPGDDGETDDQHVSNLMDELEEYGFTETSVVADPSGTVSQAVSLINNGVGVIQYTGHGSTTCWGNGAPLCNGDVDGLTNVGMLPWIVSVACINGEFNNGTCFGEAWLRATSGGEPTGAIGHYCSSINQSWAPPMEAQDHINMYFANENYVTYGAACYAGSCAMIDSYGASDGGDMYKTWHIFGDPTLRIVGTTVPPTGMRISGSAVASDGPNGGPFTPDTFVFTVKSHESYPIEFSVIENADWLEIATATGTVPPLGEVDVVVSIDQAAAAELENGEYLAEIEFVNETNNDGDTAKDATLKVGTPQPVYEWNMDTDPGWVTQDQWGWGRPTGNGGEYGNSDPSSGATGTNVLGYNLNGDYANNLPERHLSTGPIDCSTLTDVSVSFQRYLNVEQPWYDHAYVRASADGSSWTTVWENDAAVEDSSWGEVSYDISAIADGNDHLYLRWTMGTTDSSWQFSGWNIDDVVISGIDSDPGTPCEGDTNGDGFVDTVDILFVLSEWGPCGGGDCAGDLNGDGTVGTPDILMVLSGWGACE
jgi:gingipain R